MWYTQHKWSNFLEIFQFLWFLNFSTHSKKELEVRSTKQAWKETKQVRLIKQVCKNEKNKVTQKIEVKGWYQHQWSYVETQTVDHQEVW